MILGLLQGLAKLGLYTLFALFIGIILLIVKVRQQQKVKKDDKKTKLVFFHPFCNSAGGGEKVLWLMLSTLQQQKFNKPLEISILTGDTESSEQILQKAKSRFNIQLSPEVNFIRLRLRGLIEPQHYPFLTMLFQIIGTMILTIESLIRYQPDIFFDTTGLAYSFIIVKLFLPKCKVWCYVHYPFISHEMVSRVQQRRIMYNNQGNVSASKLLSKLKIYYYQIILLSYSLLGKIPHIIMTNSSWTNNHIKLLWGKYVKKQENLNILYPPCNVKPHLSAKLENKQNIVVSFAQYRPEKNHQLQIEVINQLLKSKNKYAQEFKFLIIGSCRDQTDEILLQNLKNQAKDYGIQDKIQFVSNIPYSEIVENLGKSAIAIHTMEAEHFGIAIVEMMAAGCITIAHNSAGPKLDIIGEQQDNVNGYLWNDQEDFLKKLSNCITLMKENREEFNKIATRARVKVQNFSDEKFKESFALQLKRQNL